MSDLETVESTEVLSEGALVFEFDQLVATTRQASYNVLTSIFEEENLNPVHMSRFGLVGTPSQIVDSLQKGLGVKKGTPRKVSEEIRNGINMHLESGLVQVSDALRNLVAGARERGLRVIGMSSLPESQREALSTALDLDGLRIELWSFGKGYESFPRADAWLRLSKEKGLKAPVCVALTTGKSACKAALTAGFRCAVVPDSFTSHEDFGGASIVAERVEDIDAAELYLDAVNV